MYSLDKNKECTQIKYTDKVANKGNTNLEEIQI